MAPEFCTNERMMSGLTRPPERAEATLDEKLGVHVADVLAVPTGHVRAAAVQIHVARPRLHLHDGHRGSLVHRAARGHEPGVPAAQNHDVERLLVDDVGIVDHGRFAQPVAGAAVAGRAAFCRGA